MARKPKSTADLTIIYRRVSTIQQDDASQLPDLKKWAEGRAGTIVWELDKFTGKTFDRPGWNRVWAEIEAGSVKQLVVWRLDRLGRSTRELVNLFAELKKRGVKLISLRENIDLDSISGQLLADILAAVASFETELRRERIMAGIAAAKAKGKVCGGRETGSLNAKTAKAFTTILELDAKGVPRAQIARAVDVTLPTVYKILRENGRKIRTKIEA